MCKFALEGSGDLLDVIFKNLINIKDWFYRNISNTNYYLLTQRPRRKKLYINAFNLTGLQRCVMLWILKSPTKTVGPSISYAANRDILDCFISLESKNLICLDHSDEISGTWTRLSIFFRYEESDPGIIGKALSSVNATDDCTTVFDRLTEM